MQRLHASKSPDNFRVAGPAVCGRIRQTGGNTMSSNKPEPYIPYRKDDRENSNDITSNEPAPAYVPNGWSGGEFEKNAFEKGRK
jgi:hypothetical protein